MLTSHVLKLKQHFILHKSEQFHSAPQESEPKKKEDNLDTSTFIYIARQLAYNTSV